MTDLEHAQLVIERLNEIVKHDPWALYDLIECRVACNAALADHPSVQVSCVENGYRVGLLGLLNGIVGVRSNGWGYVAAVMDEETRTVQRFELLTD